MSLFGAEVLGLSPQPRTKSGRIHGETIINLAYSIAGGTAEGLRQVRIASTDAGVPPVLEPATWAMMLLGFGAAGFALRRSRRPALLQIA